MSRVEIPVEAKLNSGDIDAELKQLTQRINTLGQSIAKANQVKFNPITKASLDDVKRMNAEFEKLKRTSQLGADLNRTGQGNKSFLDLDWNSIASNSVAREARRYGAFNRVLAGSGASFTQPTPAPGGGGGGGRPSPGGGGSPWSNAGRKVVSSGLRAAGPVGGVADEAISAGASGGVMAGMAGLIGGVVALGVGKLVGSVMNKIGDAQQDSIGYDTLKRQLGDVNVSFDVLKRSIHAASDAFGGTYQQALRMGGEFAQISGISGKGSEERLAKEIANAGGFARAYGIDLDQSNRFFASETQAGVTHDDRDSKRLAVYIGEAIAKSGSFAKADEVIQAIGAYTTQQTRMGLATANVGGYTGMLTSMLGSGVPGVGDDVGGAAAILSRVNSSIANGGNAGEAGQNFMYAAIGKRLNLNPIMAAALREQGAFGTGQQEFGPGSNMAEWAARHGVNIPAGAASSTTTNLSMLMDQLHKTYQGSPERDQLRLNAMQSLYGISLNNAAFLDDLKPARLGGAMDRIKAAGIDTTAMKSDAVASMVQVALGNRGALNTSANGIWDKLSPAEQANLTKAQSGGDENYRDELLRDFAKHGQGDTEGSKTRDLVQNIDKVLTDAAGQMVPAINVMRDTMLLAFGKSGSGVMTAEDIHKQVLAGQHKEVDDRADARIRDARGKFGTLDGMTGGWTDPDIQRKNDNWTNSEVSAAEAERKAGHAQVDRGEADYQDMLKQEAALRTASKANDAQGRSTPRPSWLTNGAVAGPSVSGSRTFDVIGGGNPGERNFNPGNIEYGSFARAHGATSSDGRFAVLPANLSRDAPRSRPRWCL
jgi:hypothetical protein